jgi:indolepyruvate ferredoxin oxidoreductase
VLKTLDAQDIAQRLLGDTLPSNILMLGACWQAGLVPVGHAALMRAIELNGVAAETNKTAFALGRLAYAAPEAIERLGGAAGRPVQLFLQRDLLDGENGLIERRARFLAAYQDEALAKRYRRLVERVRQAESPLGSERLTQAVARYYAKLLAIKDEYEVARLYTDGAFERSLREQFERWDGLRFHLAPPLLARPGADGRTRKLKFGGWMWRAMALLARLRGLRGSPLDPFGYADERRMERAAGARVRGLDRGTAGRLECRQARTGAAVGTPARARARLWPGQARQCAGREGAMGVDPGALPGPGRSAAAGRHAGLTV